jgi:hypothetical protein
MKRAAVKTGPNDFARAMAARGVDDPDEFDAWMAARGWSWRRLDAGDYGIGTDEALILFTMEDPVRWCETFLIEPRTGEPWKFFDYQKPSIRAWRQDVVHQDGAEVGKTREILCLVLWGQCTSMGLTVRRPWMLIGAPQQTHLDEIILAVEEQVGVHKGAAGGKGNWLSQFWLEPKRTPHMMQRFRTVPIGGEEPGIGRVYYRPGGHDGEAFRGVHVNALAVMDEAAKIKRALIFTEFWRALEPGCNSRVYSVTDGDRNSPYFKQTQEAQPDLPPNEKGTRLFRWPKTIMPPPFWDAERDALMIKRYGSRQSPGYVRNVLGEHGDAESPVFGWDLLLPNVMPLHAFRVLKLEADRARGNLAVTVTRIELRVTDGRKHGVEHCEADSTVDLAPFLSREDAERRRAMRELIEPLVPAQRSGAFYSGVDFGETHDPTEIVISEELGARLQDSLRVQCRGLPYMAQAELIYLVDALFGQTAQWGGDLGSAGTAVVRMLQTMELFGDAHFDERMMGFQFAGVVDCIGEDGEPLRDQNKPNDPEAIVRMPAKHWATQCMVQRFQNLGYGLAYDIEVLNWMTSHTAREGAKWPIYSKTNDHNLDARRVQMLAKLYAELGASVDVFASGVYHRSR